MRKATVVFFICALVFFASAGVSLAIPKAIEINMTDRNPVRMAISDMMQQRGYKLVGSDAYRIVVEKRLGSAFEDLVFRDFPIMKKPILRKLWSVLPSPGGVEAIVDIFVVSSPGTNLEKIYDTNEIQSFRDGEKFEREKLYDLFNVKAAAEGLDAYFIMRASGLFPELRPEFPRADMLMDGNRVIAVIPDGLAGKIGLMAGDIVLEVNGNQVVGDIVNLIDSRLMEGHRVMLLVQRNDALEVITFTGGE
jgi:hypothetical protein